MRCGWDWTSCGWPTVFEVVSRRSFLAVRRLVLVTAVDAKVELDHESTRTLRPEDRMARGEKYFASRGELLVKQLTSTD